MWRPNGRFKIAKLGVLLYVHKNLNLKNKESPYGQFAHTKR